MLNLFEHFCNSIDSKGEKIFEKFDKNQFEIRSIRFDSTSSLRCLFWDFRGFFTNWRKRNYLTEHFHQRSSPLTKFWPCGPCGLVRNVQNWFYYFFWLVLPITYSHSQKFRYRYYLIILELNWIMQSLRIERIFALVEVWNLLNSELLK